MPDRIKPRWSICVVIAGGAGRQQTIPTFGVSGIRRKPVFSISAVARRAKNAKATRGDVGE